MRLSVVGTAGSTLGTRGIPFRLLSPLPGLHGPCEWLVPGNLSEGHPGAWETPHCCALTPENPGASQSLLFTQKHLTPQSSPQSLWDLWDQAVAGTLPKPPRYFTSFFLLCPLPSFLNRLPWQRSLHTSLLTNPCLSVSFWKGLT